MLFFSHKMKSISFLSSYTKLFGVVVLALGAWAAARAVGEPMADSPSAFLRDQTGSAIHWQPWNEQTLKHAKEEGRPVYVFIGYFLSELSRATTRQSFANPEVVEFLNQNFYCILVDRDEQPELAACAQHYLRTVKQLDGWPAHLWLTPELQPFEGGSYLPPSEEWGKASFIKIARQAKDAWTTDATACRSRAAEAVSALAHPFSAIKSEAAHIPEKLTAAATAWRETADAVHGGFGDAPKAPEPELLRFLLRQSPADRAIALATLHAIIAGAIHDPIDHGFFERTTDAAWRMPNFQKTLMMQARLALAFLDGAQISGDAPLAAGAREALDYALARLALPKGGFAAAQDGTGETLAGYFAWTEAEIDSALGADAAAFKTAYGVVAAGNVSAEEDASGVFTGKNLLYRATPVGEVAAEAALVRAAGKLSTVRDQRAALPRDERATAGAHGLMLAALSRAGVQLAEPKYLDAAKLLFATVKKEFITSATGDVRRLRGSASAGTPVDYAALALGCREYGQATKNNEADTLAAQLLARVDQLYVDSASGHYYSSPAELPIGLFTRAPAAVDTLSAEAIALQAGVPADVAKALQASLVASLESTPTAPGDGLLALVLAQPTPAKP